MIRFFILLALCFLAACASQPEHTVKIAVIRGETMNIRFGKNTAPYELKSAYEVILKEKKPLIKFVSRQRALELFKLAKVDVVVSGHASKFPEEFKEFETVKDKTEAIFLQLKKHPLKIKNIQELYKAETTIAILRDSSFENFFVSNVKPLSLIIVNDFRDALILIEKNKISGVVIDEVAYDHVRKFMIESRITELKLGEKEIYTLEKNYRSP